MKLEARYPGEERRPYPEVGDAVFGEVYELHSIASRHREFVVRAVRGERDNGLLTAVVRPRRPGPRPRRAHGAVEEMIVGDEIEWSPERGRWETCWRS